LYIISIEKEGKNVKAATEIEMEQNTNESEKEELTVPAFAYELLRDILIPDLLGKDTSEILYWAGKHLARKFPLMSVDEIIAFFNEAGWGNLSVSKQDKHGIELELTSELITRQFDLKTEARFKLEAGFLAEQVQTQKKILTEANDEIIKKAKKVRFIVQWDSRDSI
jgi:predicted hydrocarbon binding protein